MIQVIDETTPTNVGPRQLSAKEKNAFLSTLDSLFPRAHQHINPTSVMNERSWNGGVVTEAYDRKRGEGYSVYHTPQTSNLHLTESPLRNVLIDSGRRIVKTVKDEDRNYIGFYWRATGVTNGNGMVKHG